jgi:type III pantothenate kinase
MKIHYDRPQDVGRDRLANALAAREMHTTPGQAAIAISLGTATTFDVVDAAGDFAGGAIASGLGSAASALRGYASHLPGINLEPPATPIGHSTTDCLRTGLVLGHAVMVDGLVRRFARELGMEPTVVATGGWAATVAPVCETIQTVEPNLTLHGIRLAWERNQGCGH